MKLYTPNDIAINPAIWESIAAYHAEPVDVHSYNPDNIFTELQNADGYIIVTLYQLADAAMHWQSDSDKTVLIPSIDIIGDRPFQEPYIIAGTTFAGRRFPA